MGDVGDTTERTPVEATGSSESAVMESELASSSSGGGGGGGGNLTSPRKARRSTTGGTSSSSGPLLSSGERRTSRRERLSGRGFMPPAISGGGFDDSEYDEDDEADPMATTDMLLDLGRRVSFFFGANLAINLPLRLVSLRQAAYPLGSPQNSIVNEVRGLLSSSSSATSLSAGGFASSSPTNPSWKYILGTSAIIGMAEVAAGLFSGATSMYFDSGHIPIVDEWHEHEKPTFYGLVSRKQLAVFAGKLLTGLFFYPVFLVVPILLATQRWPGTRQFVSDLINNRNGVWGALALNVIKYSMIDLAPFLENKLYHYLKLVPEEGEDGETDEEFDNSFFSMKHLEKYGLSFTSTLLAALLYVPLDVLSAQLIVHPTQYTGVVDCFRKVWAAEGWKGLYRGFTANLLSEQELLFI